MEIDFNKYGREISAEDSQLETIPVKKGFISSVQSNIANRGANIADIGESVNQGNIGKARGTLRVAGQLAGSITDVVGETISGAYRLLPDFLENKIESGARSILQTPAGQAGIKALHSGYDSYQNWKSNNPELAADLESVVNIAAILPIGKGVQMAEKGLMTRAGETAIESGIAKQTLTRESFIKDLLNPEQTKLVKESQVSRTTESGFGPFKISTIAPDRKQIAAMDEVAKIEGVSSSKTLQGNYNTIRAANTLEAENLKQALIANDFSFPKKELVSRLNATKAKLLESPAIVGDEEKIASKLIDEIQRRLNLTKAKGSELLQIRKDFDNWVESQKGSSVFDPSKENAFTLSNREIRQTINTFLDENAPTVGVRESLRKQSNLFNALDTVKVKAAVEADTAFKRTLQKIGQILGTKSKIVQGIAAAVGIGGLGAAATFAPPAAGAMVGGWLIYKGGQLILHPQVRILLGDALKTLDKPITRFGTTKKVLGIQAAKAEIEQLLQMYD